MSGTSAVIAAAGRGERFGSGGNKVFATAGGRPLLAHSALAFERCDVVREVVVVVGAPDVDRARAALVEHGITKLAAVVAGGPMRQESVANGLAAVSPDCDIVAIHDGARPLVSLETIEATVHAARSHGAAIAAVPAVETVKSAREDDFVATTLDRSVLWNIQTPQTFDKALLTRAFDQARSDGFHATDDAALVERLGHPVKLVPGSRDNIKVTTPLDLEFVEMRLAGRTGESATLVRTGIGCDIHRFAPGRKLVLGGVEFPGEEGLEGHSDADVIVHAVMDGLLGAAALGDIGMHFPNNDPRYEGASSLTLLREVGRILSKAGWAPLNVDATLIAERPKVASRVPEMQANIAEALGVNPSQVSIKATTAEGLGDIGRGLGAECHAVATVRRT